MKNRETKVRHLRGEPEMRHFLWVYFPFSDSLLNHSSDVLVNHAIMARYCILTRLAASGMADTVDCWRLD